MDSLSNVFRKWFVRPPHLLRMAFQGTFWRVPTKERVVYLTFDDGPIPEVTPWVIERLKEEEMVATFFCVGDNIRKHPQVFQLLQSSGMAIGNHTFGHIRGWKTNKKDYLSDLDRFDSLFSTGLFRPPHGQLTHGLLKALRKRYQKVVMWDILTHDYDARFSAKAVVDNALSYTRPGSIIVFHDSLKAWPRLKEALPLVLKQLKAQGYKTGLLDS